MCTSAAPLLPRVFSLLWIVTTTGDSDFSMRPIRLAGLTSLNGEFGPCGPSHRDLPVYFRTLSNPAARADPAGSMRSLVAVNHWLLLSAFANLLVARLSGAFLFRGLIGCGLPSLRLDCSRRPG